MPHSGRVPADLIRGLRPPLLRSGRTDARTHGSLALAGRLEPKYMAALSEFNCIFMHRNSSLVVHSANHDIVNALHRGDAFFTRLEGEWWTRLQGDTFKEDI